MATDPNVIIFEKSSNLTRAEYDPESKACVVTFKNGTVYRYGNFSPAMIEDWRGAKSAGTWFHSEVKQRPEAHPCEAVPSVARAAQTKVEAAPPREQKPAPSKAQDVAAAKPDPVSAELALARRQSVELEKLAAFIAENCPNTAAPGGSVVDAAIAAMTKQLAEIRDRRASEKTRTVLAEDGQPVTAAKDPKFRPWRKG